MAETRLHSGSVPQGIKPNPAMPGAPILSVIGNRRNTTRQQSYGFRLPMRSGLGEDTLEMATHGRKPDAHIYGYIFKRSSPPKGGGNSTFCTGKSKEFTQPRHGNRRFGVADEYQHGRPLFAKGGS